MSLGYKEDLIVKDIGLEKKFEENDQLLRDLMFVLKKTALRDRIFSLFVKAMYLVTIPLFLWALGVDSARLDDINSPMDMVLIVSAIFCVGFISIHSRVSSSKTNNYEDSHSIGEYAQKIFRAKMLKNLKVALKKSKAVFNQHDENLNVMMTMVYIFSQNSVIGKTDKGVETGFSIFKELNSSLSNERVLSLYLEKCITDFLSIYFILNPEEESTSLKKTHKMYQRKLNDIVAYEEDVKRREAKALEKKNLKEKKMQLNGLDKSALDIKVEKEDEKILADGYIDRRYFN